MPFLAAAAPIIGAAGGIAGGILGAAGSGSSQNTQVTGLNNPLTGGVSLPNGQTLGQFGAGSLYGSLNNLQGQVNSAAPFNANANANLAQMLQQYAQTGGLPNQQQIGSATQFAQSQFAPAQAALQNQYVQAQQATNQQAANLGRSVNDPVLQAKLAQYMGQQQGVLQGQQTALAGQTAMQLPLQQLNFQQALANQAMQNQQSIFGLGSGLLQNAQNYNLGFRGSNVQGLSGAGGQGGLLGALGGLSGGLKLGGAFGASTPTPSGGEGNSQDLSMEDYQNLGYFG